MKTELVIFDMDGTLLNTLDDLTDSANYTLRQFNFPQKNSEQIRQAVGNGVAKFIERIIPDGANNPDFEKFMEDFKHNYSLNMNNKTRPYEQIPELLKNLRNNGLKVAVASNKFDSAVKELCKKYFPGLTDYAAGENLRLGIREKPNPDMLNEISRKLNIPIENSYYIGDSEVDIQTAKNSNIPCISVTWGFEDKDFLIKNGAEIIADTPNEILNILEDL